MAGPLTTIFTPPAQCTEDVWWYTYTSKRVFAVLGGTDYSSCLPKSFRPDPSAPLYYSPGLYCPVGYSTACSATTAIGSETETIATCCPTGFKCQERTGDKYPWENTLGCTSACLSEYPVTFTVTSSVRTGKCNLGGGANAYSVQLRFRAVDVTTTSGAILSISAATGSVPTPNMPANTGITAISRKDGLTTGAKAGIGVGTALGVALIAAICWLAWAMHKKSKIKHQGVYDEVALMHQTHNSQEAKGTSHAQEADAQSAVHEAPNLRPIYELGAGK